MQKYECQVCGAELHWDPNAGSLKCRYCDTEYQPSDFEDKTTEEGAEDTSAAVDKQYTSHADTSSDMLVYKCDECGAEVVASDSTMQTVCPYCGRAISITDKTAGNFRPEKLIPFAVDRAKATELLTKYTKASILTPKLFKDEHTIEKTQGLFVPFYLHSFKSKGRANIEGKNSTSHRRGDDKVTTHKVYEVNLEAQGDFQDIPTDASSKLDNALMDALEPYSYDKVQDFNPAFMAGFFAEQPDESVEITNTRAETRAKEAMDKLMLDEAGAFEEKHILTSNYKFGAKTNKYAMLPVWLMHVDWGGKKYTYAVNGETGEVVGKLPISKGTLAAILGGAFAAIQLVAGIVMIFV